MTASSVEGRRPVVLVVDDDDINRAVFVHALTRIGCEVLQAAGAKAAMLYCTTRGRAISLVIVDLNLSDGWGTQVALEFRRHCPAVPILFTSGTPVENWRPQDSATLKQLGNAADFLPKPFQLKTLQQKVQELTRWNPSSAAPIL